MPQVSRRDFLCQAAMSGAFAGAASLASSNAAAAERGPKLPMRPFGKTGVNVSILGLGGGGRGRNPQIRGALERSKERALAEKIILRALEAGVNYFDTCTGYGASEEILGHVVKAHRKDMFLATKNHHSIVPADRLRQELEQSLRIAQAFRPMDPDEMAAAEKHVVAKGKALWTLKS